VWSGANGTGTRTVISFSGSGGTGVCNNLTRTVASAATTYGNPVAGLLMFPNSGCSGSGVFIPTDGLLYNVGPFTMHSYVLVHN
jgi:hypothetical protein